MPRDLTSVRLDAHATCAYVLFVEGLRRAYTTDITGALWGSGVGTWVYTSELAAGDREVAGSREVVPGLVIPESVQFTTDLKTGMLQPEPASFSLLDIDGHLADLFASEGRESEILAERIPPGTADLGASVATQGGTANPRGRYVGIERIGPDGERRFFPALPFNLVGYDHPVHAGAVPPAGLPPVLISDEPIDHVGRVVALYRIYKDPDSPATDGTAWYSWSAAHAAGDLAWFGVLSDSGNVGANRMWTIDCHGPDAFLRKTLGTRNTVVRTRINADVTLEPEESYVAIGFEALGVAGISVRSVFDSSIFDHQITATTSRAQLAAQINTWIEDALDGVDTNVTFPDGPFTTWLDAAGNANPDAGITDDGRIFIRREDQGVSSDLTFGVMYLAMHERAWRKLGWEPETQRRNATAFDDVTHVLFTDLEAGDQLTRPGATGITVPGPGYIMGEFTTIRVTAKREDISDYANGGAPRYWYPYHTSEVFVLDRTGGQVIRLTDEEPTSLYIEGQITAGYSSLADIPGAPAVSRARYFMIEGNVVTVDDDPETEEVEVTEADKLAQVVLASWAEGTHYGTVSEGVDLNPALYVERYLDPRGFGSNHRRRNADWSGKVVGAGEIEISPLNVYHYFIDDAPFEQASTLLSQILLSTGACAGYLGALDTGPALPVAGPNTHTSPVPPLFAGDYELADLGLGVPWQIVQHPDDTRAVFDTLPGGAAGDLCRLRLVYLGPYKAVETLESITKPRSICWSLRQKQLGVFRLGPVSPEDVDIIITPRDLYGTVGDPTTTHPSQRLRATGQVDGVELAYRADPSDGNKTAATWSLRALDAGASRRTGELISEVEDHGLPVPAWYSGGADLLASTGVTDWRGDFRQLWQRDVPEFFAKRHFAATMTVSRPKGQDLMPGSSVSITSPWLVSPAGGYGIVAATGRVIRATHFLSTGATEIEAIVFAVPGPLHFAPGASVSGVTGAVVSYYAGTDSGHGFAEPDWSDSGGQLEATIYQRSGGTYTAIDVRAVLSVDITARTLTLDSAPAGYLRDRDHYITLAPRNAQPADSWPIAVYGTQADTDNTIGDGTTPASQFL